MIGLLYSLQSYWIRQFQSDKTVFALGRSPLNSRINDERKEGRWRKEPSRSLALAWTHYLISGRRKASFSSSSDDDDDQGGLRAFVTRINASIVG